MNNKLGRSVRLFLTEGTASGLTTAEIINWTGHILTGSRNGLSRLLQREELTRTGIYFLAGTGWNDLDTPRVYIGESDSVGKRLIQHSRDGTKGFWERTCVITSKDQNITKAHARYLEASLIAIASKVGTASVVNSTMPPPIALPEADQSDMECFIDQILLILPVLGFDFLRQPRVAGDDTNLPDNEDSPIFQLVHKKRGIEAQAREVDGEFVVLKGSTAIAAWWGKSLDHSYAKLHAQLVRSARLVPERTDILRFSANVAFRSPSAAAAVVLARPVNGRTAWKTNGVTYHEWDADRIARMDVTSHIRE